jgi:type IV secretory pathway TraG/TraD family ATPase VirD4
MTFEHITIGTTTRGLSLHVPVTVDPVARARHTVIFGQTGTGKSVLLRNICAQIAAQGGGFAFLDPHGENAEIVVSLIPANRAAEFVYIDLGNTDDFVGINFLDGVPPEKRATAAANVVAAFVHIFGKDAVGDRSQEVLRNSLMALMEAGEATLLSVLRMLRSDSYRGRIVSKIQDPLVRSYWVEAFETWDPRFRDQVTAPISNKLDACLSHPAIRHIISQPKNRVDFRKIMDERRILIVNLSKGSVGELPCRLFGALMVSAITSAAFSRSDIEEDERQPFDLVLDEFSSVITTDITTILSEARKYRLQLTLASQYLSQIPDDILAAVFGNAGTYISFRLGTGDASEMARQFGIEDEKAFLDLPNFTARIRPLVNGNPGSPQYVDLLPPPMPLHDRAVQLVRNSNVRFSRKRQDIEAQIQRLFAA